MSVGTTLPALGAIDACLQVRAERWSVRWERSGSQEDGVGVGRMVTVAAIC